jgi:type I restriction enzyme, S subunit
MIDKSILPNHWEVKKLKDIAEITSSKRIFQNDYVEAGVPFFRTKEIKELSEGKELSIELFISKEKYEEIKSKFEIPKPGDILISAVGTIGVSYIIKHDSPFYFKDGNLLWIRKLKGVNSKYLNYFIAHFIRFKQNIATSGSAYNALTIVKLKEFDLSFPPLPEQQEIVAKIEELFSELDKGKEQLETARQQLKVYRQAVLNSAVTGEPTQSINSVIETLDQGWSPKCYNEPSTNTEEWAVIKTTAVQNGSFDDTENKRLPENLTPREQHELNVGDLLITRAGPRVRVGICCMVRKTRPKLLNCDKVYRMRIDRKVAIPEFIELLLNSPKYSREIEKLKTGISDSGVNLTQKGFLKIMIPLPSLEEQNQIVQEIESRLSVCDKVEETISHSLQQAETLRQSILKQAFEGTLTTEISFS